MYVLEKFVVSTYKMMAGLTVLAALSGCVATEPVAPYERGYLAEEGMPVGRESPE